MQHIATDGSKMIRFEWEKKRVKNINLRIRLDGSVYVSSAPGVPAKTVERFVLSRAELIERAQLQLSQRRPETDFIVREGARLPCLGKELTLHIAAGAKNSAALQGDTLVLTLQEPTDSAAADRVFHRWWGAACVELFTSLCKTWYPHFRRWDFAFPTLRFRRMSSRWGSCQPRTGIVTLNKRLLHAPMPCIEYIIVHELAHFVEANHSPAFHAVVTEVMPDWKERQKLLVDSVIPL